MLTLHEMLRRNEAEAFLRNAQIVSEYPDCPERADAAREQVQRAMYRAALRHISDDERARIVALLAPCCPDLFPVVPPRGSSPAEQRPDRWEEIEFA